MFFLNTSMFILSFGCCILINQFFLGDKILYMLYIYIQFIWLDLNGSNLLIYPELLGNDFMANKPFIQGHITFQIFL
jgi:hypothetical protein